MAQRLPNCDLASAGRPAKYPWREWADGSVWHIVRGVDYDVATRSMRATLFAYAAREDLAVRTRRVTVDGQEGLVFRFDVCAREAVGAGRRRRGARRRRGRRTRRSGFAAAVHLHRGHSPALLSSPMLTAAEVGRLLGGVAPKTILQYAREG